MGRPVTWTPDERQRAINHVLVAVACGRSAASALRDDGMPAASLFWAWHFADEALQDQLARARLSGVEVHMEQINDIADGVDIERDKDGMVTDPAQLVLLETNRAKLRIDTRIKRAQMIAPRKYGPKLDVTSDGAALPGKTDNDVASKVTTILASVRERVDAKPDGTGLDFLLS